MLTRNSCIKSDALGDGHCLRRCFLILLFGKGGDTPERLRQLQYVLAFGLIKFREELNKMVVKYAKEENFQDYCIERADILRGIDSSKPCSRHEWGGGEYSCDMFVFAALLRGQVVMSTPNKPNLHVYSSNFEVTEVAISEYMLRPGDIPVSWVWGGSHFIPYIRQGNLLYTCIYDARLPFFLSVFRFFFYFSLYSTRGWLHKCFEQKKAERTECFFS